MNKFTIMFCWETTYSGQQKRFRKSAMERTTIKEKASEFLQPTPLQVRRYNDFVQMTNFVALQNSDTRPNLKYTILYRMTSCGFNDLRLTV